MEIEDKEWAFRKVKKWLIFHFGPNENLISGVTWWGGCAEDLDNDCLKNGLRPLLVPSFTYVLIKTVMITLSSHT